MKCAVASAIRFHNNRWISLCAAILLESIAGLSYMFGVYSQELKTNSWVGGQASTNTTNNTLLQSQLEFVATATVVGANVLVHLGLIFDLIGSFLTLLIAALAGGLGFGLMWATLAYAHRQWPYWLLILSSFLQGQAQGMVDLVAVATVTSNFPLQRGLALGVCKAFLGLSGSIVTTIYQGFFENDIRTLMLFLTLDFVVVCVLGMLLVTKLKREEIAVNTLSSEQNGARNRMVFTVIYSLTAIAVAEMVGSAFAFQFVDDLKPLFRALLAGGMLFILLVLVLFTASGNAFTSASKRQQNEETIDYYKQIDMYEVLAGPDSESSTDTDKSDVVDKLQSIFEDMTLLGAMTSAQFWLLAWALGLSGSAGLVIVGNIAQIVKNVPGYHAGMEDTFVTLISVANCGGRMFFGYISDWALRVTNGNLPRPAFLAIASLLIAVMLACQALIVNMAFLYVSVVFIGFGFGGIASVCAVVLSEIAGSKHLGSLYGAIFLILGSGSYVLPKLVAGYFYDLHRDEATNLCAGWQCFGPTYLISSGCALLACLLSVVLTKLTRTRYKTLYGNLSS